MTAIPEVSMSLRQTVAVIGLGLGLLSIVLYFVRARQLRERYCKIGRASCRERGLRLV